MAAYRIRIDSRVHNADHMDAEMIMDLSHEVEDMRKSGQHELADRREKYLEAFRLQVEEGIGDGPFPEIYRALRGKNKQQGG